MKENSLKPFHSRSCRDDKGLIYHPIPKTPKKMFSIAIASLIATARAATVEQFCADMGTHCPTQVFAGDQDCTNYFNNLPVGTDNSNAATRLCAEYHLGLAKTADVHCSHAAGIDVCVAAGTVKQGWDNHVNGFVAQNKTLILQDYTEESILLVHDFGSGVSRKFTGLTEIGNAFDTLWNYMNTKTFYVNQAVVDENPRNHVFLSWRMDTKIKNAVDTFDFVGAKIVYQTLAISVYEETTEFLLNADSGGTAINSTMDTGAATDVFARHFEAFGTKNMTKMLLDYSSDCVINVLDLTTNILKTFNGLDGVRALFNVIFADIVPSLNNQVQVPVDYTTEESNDRHAAEFLAITWPGLAPNWVDTFLYNGQNQFYIQNIAAQFTTEISTKMFCTSMNTTCPGQAFAGGQNCTTYFNSLPIGTDDTGATKRCAEYHLGLARTQGNAHCPHASGLEICVAAETSISSTTGSGGDGSSALNIFPTFAMTMMSLISVIFLW
jgi:hypothetical protein